MRQGNEICAIGYGIGLTTIYVGHIQAPVKLGELKLLHNFVVVEYLVTPVILGWISYMKMHWC